MEIEGDARKTRSGAEKLQNAPTRRKLPLAVAIICFVVSMYGQERPSISLASISNWQARLEPRLFNCGELGAGEAQKVSAQATVFEAEVKDKLEEAKETVSSIAEVSQNGPQHGPLLTDAEVEQLLGEFSWILVGTKRVGRENPCLPAAYSTRLSDLAGQLEAASAHLVDWTRDKRRPLIFISRRKDVRDPGEDRERIDELHRD